MTINSSSNFSADVSAYKGGKRMGKFKMKPKALKGKQKQVDSVSKKKSMGNFGRGKQVSKAREHRLEKEAV